MRSDNRSNTVDRIEETFANAKKYKVEEHLIVEAKNGVEKLCSTYVADPTTVARLETIMERGKGAAENGRDEESDDGAQSSRAF